MKNSKHGIRIYSLEYEPGPGSRETRVRRAPDGIMVRSVNEKNGRDG